MGLMSLVPNANCGFEFVSSSKVAATKGGVLQRVHRVGCTSLRLCWKLCRELVDQLDLNMRIFSSVTLIAMLTSEAAGSDSLGLPYLPILIWLCGLFPYFLFSGPSCPTGLFFGLIPHIIFMISYLFPWPHLPPQCLQHPSSIFILDFSTNLDLTSIK